MQLYTPSSLVFPLEIRISPRERALYCLELQTFSYFLPPFLYPLIQVSTIATSDGYAKNLADSFETAARLQGIRIHASSRLSSMASPEVVDNKVQLVSVFLYWYFWRFVYISNRQSDLKHAL